ncbi:hypothetical protein [Haloarcula rara]|uniref:hypothetical protein n=2 Tax=Haloarcula TaxID=2237 RepID=UPI0023E8F7E0|nr:hypothetical protein [Halomicroarcula sp. SHR3]
MTAEWGFTTSRPTDARYGDDVAKYAMSDGEQGLKTFVREVLQNSNDARLENDEPAEVTFRLETLEGDELRSYLEALDISTWSEHAGLSGETESGEHIVDAMSRIEEEDALRILTIEDKNTAGLLGAETADESNFTALVRDVLFSSKSGDTAGGSYGLGKAVLWLFSGLSMVLFNSTLSEPDPRDDSPRLIGRTRLPTHKSADGETVFQGHGWYGKAEESEGAGRSRPESLWGEAAADRADPLRLTRPDSSGTSIQVVDFRVPTAEERLDDTELAEEITDLTLEWFWPAIYNDNLKVNVETETETREASLDVHPKYTPFTSCLSERGEAVEELEEPGDITDTSIDLTVPPKTGDSGETDGELALLVRRAQPDEVHKRNSVAFVRGAGMVVEYYDRDKIVVGNEDFHGVLLGGKARPWGTGTEATETDRVVEEFLTAAEPPRHNQWERTETLANTYSRGFKKAVEGIKPDVTDKLRSLVAPNVDRGATGPERLGNRFKIGNEAKSGRSKRESPSSQRVSGETDISFDETYDHWVFEGNIEPLSDGYEIREVTVSLVRMGEERATNDRLPVANVSSNTPGVGVSLPEENDVQVGRLNPSPGTTSVTFEGSSDLDQRRVETRLKVSVDIAKRGDE